MEHPRLGPQELVYENDYQRIYRVVADFGSFSKEYYVNDFGARAGLVVVRNDQVLLVRQYRLLINGISLEIPGGKVDDGEEPETAAIRECYEETGVMCERVTPLIHYHLGMDVTRNPTYVYYCNFVSSTAAITHGHVNKETLGHVWVQVEKCIDRICQGKILDSLTIVALLSYLALIR